MCKIAADVRRQSPYTSSCMDLALFDFDGTITFHDTFTPFIRETCPKARLWLGTALLSPLILGYKAGWLSGPQMRRAMVACAFRGRRVDEVAASGTQYASGLDRRVRPRALERLHWHRERGDRIVIVSASLRAYLEPWCAERNLDLICSDLESVAGVLTGRYAGRDVTGTEKARRVREQYRLDEFAAVHAYGDTLEDAELLNLAHYPTFRWGEQSSKRDDSR
jgi:phosphatidylglycerophosphatase C